ncbi:helix-turn-helix transcriptional regulator [Amycolatopsis sp., V23-08]|uniref:Helix-turn-helix transcriptional regulator n=1 Tax=Amycolatopsis heterodermiae TaxID=3110235 RepID=A0ABU5RKM4_9PSEU|nr:helix-turn-helix transcriptional regulator [Amycolatopsis sp., V23-08]MEA5366114.1 helix-turn-helix transcriptional regulator [Amycolatopsis sp., V23-08]
MPENEDATTSKALRLGAAIRQERSATGISLSEFARTIGMAKSRLSNIENGHAVPKEHELGTILTRLDVTGVRYEEIVGLLDGADAAQWVATSLADQARQHEAYVDFEQKAGRIVENGPLLIPGIAQTEGYARAIMSSGGTVPPEQISTRVATRLGRRAVISPDERTEPAALVALIGEPAIRRVIGGRAVMLKQLEYLLKISKWDNVEIRITAEEGWGPNLEGAFTLIEPRAAGTPAIVFLETRRSGLILHREEDVAAYRAAVELVVQAAMSPTESAELIASVIDGLTPPVATR